MRPTVVRAPLGRWVDPAPVYASLRSDPAPASGGSFWLDSGPGAVRGMSYVGVASSVVTDSDMGLPVIDWLRTELAVAKGIEALSDSTGGFTLGWVGWLGYEVSRETMGTVIQRPSRYPDAAWMRVQRAIAFDHDRRAVTLLAFADDIEAWAGEVARRLEHAVDPRRSAPESTTAMWAYSDKEYLEMIAACQAAIVEGDAYQLCLTTEASIEVRPDPLATYLALREASPTHHGAILEAAGVSLLSASPEQFMSISPGGVVSSSPIKGTRKRGTTDAADAELRSELELSDKERAENVMIVDLMRNDIGRVCHPGSISVTSLLAVESYAQVHQLVSTVQGTLRDGLTGIDAIEACFPAGSMTGAPKSSAVAILDRLERRARGIYSGVFGYIGFNGTVDLAMVIRSIIIDQDGATVGTGGGITALSVPEEELGEAKLKAAALLGVLNAQHRTDGTPLERSSTLSS